MTMFHHIYQSGNTYLPCPAVYQRANLSSLARQCSAQYSLKKDLIPSLLNISLKRFFDLRALSISCNFKSYPRVQNGIQPYGLGKSWCGSLLYYHIQSIFDRLQAMDGHEIAEQDPVSKAGQGAQRLLWACAFQAEAACPRLSPYLFPLVRAPSSRLSSSGCQTGQSFEQTVRE